ncbi:MAG TPA: hypothetical protein VMH20_01775 [Verrucomicrobiae bacterium]|nr:hypothetical protein [Verrucomicrobiae bacterium]
MKRPFFGVIAVGLLTTLGAVPKASADWWWHHSSPQPAGAGADSKSKHTKSHGRDPGMAKPVALYNSPKSLGWWHKYPGPMGAGGELVAKNQPHAENAQPAQSVQNTSPQSQSAPSQNTPGETATPPDSTQNISSQNQNAQSQSATSENAKPQQAAQNTSKHHGLFGWLHRHHASAPAAAQPTATATPATTTATNSDEQ